MHSRWACLARGCGRRETQRRLQRDASAFARRRRKLETGASEPRVGISLVLSPRSSCSLPDSHRESRSSATASLPRSLHTSPAPFSAFSGSGDDGDDDQGRMDQNSLYDEDVELLSRTCMSHMLGDISDRDHEAEAEPSSLDYELGEASVWDQPVEEEEEDGHYDGLVEERWPDTNTARSVQANVSPQRHRRQAPKRSTYEMLLSFDPDKPPHSVEDLQLWLECESQRESVYKFRDVVQAARDRYDYSSLTVSQRLLRLWHGPLKTAIEEEQSAYFLKGKQKKKDVNRWGPYLCLLQPQKIAVILAREAFVRAVMYPADGIPITGLATRIGDAIEAEVNVQRLLQQQLEESRRRDAEEDISIHLESGANGADDTKRDLPETDLPETVNLERVMDSWMYGTSHLQRFIEEGDKLRKQSGRVRSLKYANRRAQRLLKDSEAWPESLKVKLGVALLEKLLDVATVEVGQLEERAFSYEMRRMHSGRQNGRIFLHEAVRKMVVEDSFDSLAATTTRHKPMIMAPRPWVSTTDGGYSWLRTEFMRTHSSMLQKTALEEADLSIVFDGLNVLGSVPWVINKTILSVGSHCWKANIPLGDIPSRTDFDEPPIPNRPETKLQSLDKESEVYKAVQQEFSTFKEAMMKYRRIHQKNMDLRSLRCSAVLKLDQARKFQNHEIYFPYNIDFRGRAYPVPPHLSNVGSDLCRGLLKFADSKPLGARGLYWLKVHLANLAGNDKLTFDGRVEFTDRNMANIRAAVQDPFGSNRWWTTLDDPFQGLATCHEIVNAVDSGDPPSYMCSLPVHMDGSCNGLQHYAALGLDPVGGKAVNICQADRPQDVYIGVMREVIARVAEEAALDLDYADADPDGLTKQEVEALKKNRSAKLVNGLIDRGVVKRTVMTSVYGVTYIGAKKQIQEKIEEKLEEAGHDVDEMEAEIHQACGYLASLTMDVMGELFSGARQTMNWLTACARLIAQQGQPVAFVSPIGVPVVQPYRRAKPYTVVTLLQSVVLMDWSDDLPIHKQKQVTAFPPNYVHSLDSAHMILTALEMDRRDLSFSAVHDSFWTHPCDVDEMNEVLRDCFVELYSQPLLETLKETWELRYPAITFPDLPERGDLNLDEVRRAKYFFQ